MACGRSAASPAIGREIMKHSNCHIRGLPALIALACCGPVAAVEVETDASLRATAEATLARIAPNLAVDAVRPAGMPGLIEVEAGGQLLYVSADGRHLLQGSLIDTVERVDLSERRRQHNRSEVLQTLDPKQAIAFAATEERHRVTVFTALECGYCRRFHADIEAYRAAGISIDYVLIPMGGEGSEGDLAGARVHCAADRQDAFTRATAGERIEGPMCDSGYDAGKALAARLGIRNTPTIVRVDGSISGYQSPTELSASLAALTR
jgi:thiol:disulfide interchange protein DsbC